MHPLERVINGREPLLLIGHSGENRFPGFSYNAYTLAGKKFYCLDMGGLPASRTRPDASAYGSRTARGTQARWPVPESSGWRSSRSDAAPCCISATSRLRASCTPSW